MLVFIYLAAVKRWLPRVTVGVPSPMTVVRLISFSCILLSSNTTKLIGGRLSEDVFRHQKASLKNSFMPSVVKLLPIRESTRDEMVLGS